MSVLLIYGFLVGFFTTEQVYFDKCKDVKFKGKVCDTARILKSYKK